MHIPSAAASFLTLCATRNDERLSPGTKQGSSGITPVAGKQDQVSSGADCLGQVLVGARGLWAAVELGSIRVMDGMFQHLLIFYFKRMLQFGDMRYIFWSKWHGPGALGGWRVAYLLVANFVGVVSRVSSFLAALTGVGALWVKWAIDDVSGRRWWRRWT